MENRLLGQVGSKLAPIHGLDQVVAGRGEDEPDSRSRASGTCLQIGRGMGMGEEDRIAGQLQGCGPEQWEGGRGQWAESGGFVVGMQRWSHLGETREEMLSRQSRIQVYGSGEGTAQEANFGGGQHTGGL